MKDVLLMKFKTFVTQKCWYVLYQEFIIIIYYELLIVLVEVIMFPGLW